MKSCFLIDVLERILVTRYPHFAKGENQIYFIQDTTSSMPSLEEGEK